MARVIPERLALRAKLLAPTVTALQASALKLVERMAAVGRAD